jgi:hypothetical protein
MNKLKQLFNESRIYSRFEALYYLRQEAIEAGNDITVSLSKLAEIWGNKAWCKRKAHAFLKELEACKEIEIVSAGRNGTRLKFISAPIVAETEKFAIKAVEVEKMQVLPPPTLFDVIKQNKEEGAPEFDYTKINWDMKDKVPTICLYDAYLKTFPQYSPKDGDMVALSKLVKHITKAVELQRKQSGDVTNLNVQILAKCRAFVKALKENTKYGGYDLTWIEGRYNQIITTIQQNIYEKK